MLPGAGTGAAPRPALRVPDPGTLIRSHRPTRGPSPVPSSPAPADERPDPGAVVRMRTTGTLLGGGLAGGCGRELFLRRLSRCGGNELGGDWYDDRCEGTGQDRAGGDLRLHEPRHR